MVVEEGIIVFETKVDNFPKRIIKDFYPFLIILTLFGMIYVLIEHTGGIAGTAVFITIILSIQYFYSYKRSGTKTQKVTLKDNWFYFEVIKGNDVKKIVIAKNRIGTILQFEGKGGNTAHLTILNGTEKVIEVNAANRPNRPQQLDEIAYKINTHVKY